MSPEAPCQADRQGSAKGASRGVKLAQVAVFLISSQWGSAMGYAQPGVDSQARFEVVSIKPSSTVGRAINGGNGAFRVATGGFRYTPGRLTCDLPLRSIIEEAFSLKSWQISGPGSLYTDAFEIVATMPADTSRASARRMLVAMLVDRLGLKFHIEQREFAVYGLVVDKGDQKLQEVIPNPGTYNQTTSPGRFSATAIPIRRFADWLSVFAGRPVVDSTALTGVYKIEMRWSPEVGEGREDPGIFSAVRQLGLRLDPHKAAMDVIVIDHVDRVPTAN